MIAEVLQKDAASFTEYIGINYDRRNLFGFTDIENTFGFFWFYDFKLATFKKTANFR